ncbi:FecR family protein [Ochrovirga pacifica]|uniref:FecR family protein n=1 Tax=Ochrovirga pacifica TaxID=1042376 RepID=UPI0002559FE6|nr:FecR domain-containing protein [Ochrovirga pacifica]
MDRLEKLLNAARKIAKALLKKKQMSSTNIYDLFDDEHAHQVMERLQNKKAKEKRQILITKIDVDKNKDWQKIQNQINKETKIKYLQTFGKIAAVFVLGIGVSYLYLYQKRTTSTVLAKKQEQEEIVLKLADGRVKVIHTNGESKIVNDQGKVVGIQHGAELNFSTASNFTTQETLTYNELVVPYGKTFQLTLSDGTEIHLNSGTRLKFPDTFIQGKNREVFLVGEAYFNVTKDKKHPFIVNSNDLNIRVLGTQFNVASYPEDMQVQTVLVEGSVALYSEDTTYDQKNTFKLSPGNKAMWSKEADEISLEKVDTSIYTSWIHGEIVFEHVKFKNIVKKLERHYNIKIENHNQKLAEQVFTATFDIETIEEVLASFQTNFSFTYKVQKNAITIN